MCLRKVFIVYVTHLVEKTFKRHPSVPYPMGHWQDSDPPLFPAVVSVEFLHLLYIAVVTTLHLAVIPGFTQVDIGHWLTIVCGVVFYQHIYLSDLQRY